MRADIHDGQEHKRSIHGPDTEAQDQSSPSVYIRLATHGRHTESQSRCEFVAERAARCALHDRLVTRKSDFAAASGGNIEISLAYQQRTKFGLAERAEELCKSAMCDIELQRF